MGNGPTIVPVWTQKRDPKIQKHILSHANQFRLIAPEHKYHILILFLCNSAR